MLVFNLTKHSVQFSTVLFSLNIFDDMVRIISTDILAHLEPGNGKRLATI